MLKSWAVPQGPSLDPGERRLAVHVEDHPLDYGDFEGAIPKGEYGGGTVMLWDRGPGRPWATRRGTMPPASSSSACTARASRAAGPWCGWAAKAKDKDLWLLIKERDEHASTAKGSAEDRSVLSGRTMEEIAADPERVWHGNRAQAAGRATAGEAGTQAGAAVRAAAAGHPGGQRSCRPGVAARDQARRLSGAAAAAGRRRIAADPQRPRLDPPLSRSAARGAGPAGQGSRHRRRGGGAGRARRQQLRPAEGGARARARHARCWCSLPSTCCISTAGTCATSRCWSASGGSSACWRRCPRATPSATAIT